MIRKSQKVIERENAIKAAAYFLETKSKSRLQPVLPFHQSAKSALRELIEMAFREDSDLHFPFLIRAKKYWILTSDNEAILFIKAWNSWAKKEIYKEREKDKNEMPKMRQEVP